MKGAIHKITNEDLQYIVDNWDAKTINEIGEHLKMSKTTMTAHVGMLRKLGVKLSKKLKGDSNRKVIEEFAAKWKQDHPEVS